MRRLLFPLTTCLLSGLLLSLSGCAVPTFLRPANLWKLNAQPATQRDQMYYSVPPEPVVEE